MIGRLVFSLSWLATTLLAGATAAFGAEQSQDYFSGLDRMPPAAQFRQLSLMLMVSDGADEELISAIQAQLGSGRMAQGGADPATFDFDDYTTPLVRIVDQESMLVAATQLFGFTLDHREAIAARLRDLQLVEPPVIDESAGNEISEDAIIIRNAIADSIDYAQLSGGDMEAPRLSEDYRARTIYLRNNLEFELFAAELDRLTREAVASVGGKTDAYERMFDDEIDSAGIDKKIEAAEYIYDWDEGFDERAAKLAEEILNNILDREGDMKP
jgi:hypothetical protein